MQCSPDVVRYREDLSCQCAAWCFGLEAALLQVPSAALASLFQCLALHTPSFSVSYSPKIVSIPPTSSDDLSSFVNRSTTGIEKKVSSLGKTEEKFSRKELWEYHKHPCPHCWAKSLWHPLQSQSLLCPPFNQYQAIRIATFPIWNLHLQEILNLHCLHSEKKVSTRKQKFG